MLTCLDDNGLPKVYMELLFVVFSLNSLCAVTTCKILHVQYLGVVYSHRRTDWFLMYRLIFKIHFSRAYGVYSEAQARRFSVQLGDWLIDWLSEWLSRLRDFSPWASWAMEAARRTKFGRKVAYRGWGWCPNFEYMHSTENARDTTLDDEK